jgi:hypothetical protein
MCITLRHSNDITEDLPFCGDIQLQYIESLLQYLSYVIWKTVQTNFVTKK